MIVFINKKSRSLFCNGRSVFFSKKEFLLIELIIKHSKVGRIRSKYVISQVWDSRYRGVDISNLSQLVYLVRKKINYYNIPLNLKLSKKDGLSFTFTKKLIFFHCIDFLYVFFTKTIGLFYFLVVKVQRILFNLDVF